MKKYLALLMAVVLSGCAAFESRPPVTRDGFQFEFQITDGIPGAPNERASVMRIQDVCMVLIHEDYYTDRCMGAAVRLCIEGPSSDIEGC